MDESSEIKLLRAKVALLETEKKHLIQKVVALEKKKSEVSKNILSPTINVSIIPEENQPDCPGKKDVQIYDCVDKEVSVLWNMHQKRLKTYKNIGYFVKEG